MPNVINGQSVWNLTFANGMAQIRACRFTLRSPTFDPSPRCVGFNYLLAIRSAVFSTPRSGKGG